VAIEAVQCGSRSRSPASIVADWLKDAPAALLALDAPLGWPSDLAASLTGHEAGGALRVPADKLFHRETDTAIERRLSKRPLEVGANLIARTAHAALGFLDELRRITSLPIPLAWHTAWQAGVRAIEVYPAATLRGHNIAPGEYKGTAEIEGRRGLMARLGARVSYPADVHVLENSADALDAVICVVAGCDFLDGRAVPPDDLVTARKEGWIWAPAPAEVRD
jgi:hypothetical protein